MMRNFMIAVITLSMVVTCLNVQALRDAYVAEPDPIQAMAYQAISNMGERR